MKDLIAGTLLAASIFAAACGGGAKATSNTANSSKPVTETKTTTAAGGPSETVKAIYQNAIKRDCAAIPPMLTDEFKKAVGTSKDGLDALCDSLTDSGKVTAISVTGESISGDTATVKVVHTLKEGKSENKEERMKKSGEKWLMDS